MVVKLLYHFCLTLLKLEALLADRLFAAATKGFFGVGIEDLKKLSSLT